MSTLELAAWIKAQMLALHHTRRAYRPNDTWTNANDDVLRRAYSSYARTHYPDQHDELLRLFDQGLV